MHLNFKRDTLSGHIQHMKTIKSLITIILLILAFPVLAQQPIRWRASAQVGSNGMGEVTIRAVVQPGWHLYALDLPQGGPKPTTFDFSGSKGVKFTGKITPKRAPLSVKDDLFDMELQWWDSNIEFTIPFKIMEPNASYNIVISYMACDGNTCMPPTKHTLTGKIIVPEK